MRVISPARRDRKPDIHDPPRDDRFDADDTLWHNEDHFHEVEHEFADAMTPWVDRDSAMAMLCETERRNLKIFGYGVKGFTISMIETALELSAGAVPAPVLQTLIEHGKALHTRPPRLLPDVEAVLDALSVEHDLLLVTKGDLHHQQGKVGESGLADHFTHVEIVAEKDPATYRRVLARHRIEPGEFVMVGNSLRSDVLPVLEIGGIGVHIPTPSPGCTSGPRSPTPCARRAASTNSRPSPTCRASSLRPDGAHAGSVGR